MARQYQSSPIEEAICELRLGQGVPWDLAVPGLILPGLKSQFPIREQRLVQEMMAQTSSDGVQQILKTSERAVFLSEDKRTLVQIGTRLIAVNQLKPYTGWAALRSNIELVLSILQSVVHADQFERIGLRYINRVEVSDINSRELLDAYFAFSPRLSEAFPHTLDSFIVGFDLPYREGLDHCRVQLSSAVSAGPQAASALLDIDYATKRPGTMTNDAVLQWIDQAHTNVESVFEESITPASRTLFGEMKT
jgi:uncharacterized protein (TIGR04255 family)